MGITQPCCSSGCCEKSSEEDDSSVTSIPTMSFPPRDKEAVVSNVGADLPGGGASSMHRSAMSASQPLGNSKLYRTNSLEIQRVGTGAGSEPLQNTVWTYDEVVLRKHERELGLGITFCDNPRSAWVYEIRAGSAADYFNRCHPDRKLEVDDRIVEINGQQVADIKPAEFIGIINSSEMVRLRTARAVQTH
mmetsp:Transcript_32093/g.75332  ORF Transcript_32093/g.75332 Transcript_32093/m.75332 type:complete len:191 (+) Transcript_32093:109-681(+)